MIFKSLIVWVNAKILVKNYSVVPFYDKIKYGSKHCFQNFLFLETQFDRVDNKLFRNALFNVPG